MKPYKGPLFTLIESVALKYWIKAIHSVDQMNPFTALPLSSRQFINNMKCQVLCQKLIDIPPVVMKCIWKHLPGIIC